MQIYGPSQVHGAQNINSPHIHRAPRPTPPSTEVKGDQLDLSAAGQIAAKLNEIPEIRQDRVDQLRQAIAQGDYESEKNLGAALDRLLDEIG